MIAVGLTFVVTQLAVIAPSKHLRSGLPGRVLRTAGAEVGLMRCHADAG